MTFYLTDLLLYILLLIVGALIGSITNCIISSDVKVDKYYINSEGKKVSQDELVKILQNEMSELLKQYGIAVDECFELIEELYFLNHCENCESFNHKNSKCKKHCKHDGFCEKWNYKGDHKCLIHNWYDTPEMDKIIKSRKE